MRTPKTPATAPVVLRAKAALLRRAAAMPTSGGHGTDRLLIDLAGQLEREADELERAERGK